MRALKFIIIMSFATTMLSSCSKEPNQEITNANAAVDAAIADGALEYASEDAKRLNDVLAATLEEVKAQQDKFFKNFNKSKKMLSEVKADAEALKAALPTKKEEMKKAALEDEARKATIGNAIKVDEYCLKNTKRANCWDFNRVLAAYTLNVVSYFDLDEKYNTDLKKEAFKKTQEYKNKMDELNSVWQRYFGNYFFTEFYTRKCQWYSSSLSDTCTDYYDLKRKGMEIGLPYTITFVYGYMGDSIKIIFPALPTDKCYSYSSDDAYVRIEKAPNCNGEKLFLQMSEEKGLAIENALSEDKLVIYFIFKVSDAKPYEHVTDAGLVKFIGKEKPILIGNPVKIEMANKKTGEIYFDKVYIK